MERYRDVIADVEEAQDMCRDCQGDCWRTDSLKGTMPVVAIVGDYVYEGLAICQFEKRRREQERRKRLFQSAKVPAAYACDHFDDYKVTENNSEVVSLARLVASGKYARGIFVYGPKGTGKTKLAAIIANELIGRGEPVLFSSVPDLLSDIKASFGKGTTLETVLTAKNIKFLVMDDFGAERMTEWVGEQLFTIINHRYNEKLVTVITSNYPPGKLVGRMAVIDKDSNVVDDTQGQRIMSRIFGMCDVIYLPGEDYRLEESMA